jgi:CRP/FNR family cyclic AMP-dependent transcriptional regulator
MDRHRIEVLRATAMFGALSDEAIGFLLERAKPHRVAAGTYFFEQGERGGSAFLLERGHASVIKTSIGHEHKLRELGPGDCFGEVALLDFGPRSASVRADDACEALEWTAIDLHRLGEQYPEQFTLIYMNLGRELSRRLRDADERLFRARFQSTDARVANDYRFGVH